MGRMRGTTIIEVLIVILILNIWFVFAVYAITYRRMAKKELMKNPVISLRYREFKNE
jgi:competence protein ComGC